MAANYSDLVAGAERYWTSSGGTHVLTLTSLATAGCREGDKSATLIDGTMGLPECLVCSIEGKVGSAATNGLAISLYLAFSPSGTAGTANPAALTGADAAVANPTEKTPNLAFAGDLVMSNALGTGLQRSPPFVVLCPTAWVIPVAFNNSGQTMGGTGTDHVVRITPMYRRTPVA